MDGRGLGGEKRKRKRRMSVASKKEEEGKLDVYSRDLGHQVAHFVNQNPSGFCYGTLHCCGISSIQIMSKSHTMGRRRSTRCV
jgi:hypothetical protein